MARKIGSKSEAETEQEWSCLDINSPDATMGEPEAEAGQSSVALDSLIVQEVI